MATRTKMSQVKSGLRLAGLVVLSFFVAGMFFGGVAMLCFPGTIDSSYFLGRYPSVFGPVFLSVSMPTMIATMNRWVKIFGGFLALAVVNGAISIMSGHLLANPTQPVSRLDAFYLTAFFATAAALAWTVGRRKLSVVDRISVMSFLFIFGCQLGYKGPRDVVKIAPLNATDFTFMGFGLSCLLVAWGYNRLQRGQVSNRR